MPDEPKKPGESNGHGKPATFSFSQEELAFIQPRVAFINQMNVMAQDMRFVIDTYLIKNVMERVGVDPQGKNINFDAMAGTFSVEEKTTTPANDTRATPEITLPPDAKK